MHRDPFAKQWRAGLLLLLLTAAVLNGCAPKEEPFSARHRIVFFGDSITELGVKPNGYVTLIRDSLKSIGADASVTGAGISGNKIGDLLARAERDVLPHRPTVVVIYIGINDVWHYAFASRGLSGTPKQEFDAGLRTLVTSLQSAGARTVLCTPTVIGERKNGANTYDAMLEEYSAVTRSVAAATGSALCDLRQTFTSYLALNNPDDAAKDILTYDGVHLNDAGNRLTAVTMMQTLDGMGLFFPQR
ncbi:MAG: G-D-S-L family lipolytic protein [Bacteroidetes bacterium]|nr:G-D-S-L family lipolytic protein [Bacteroidota bacterium]